MPILKKPSGIGTLEATPSLGWPDDAAQTHGTYLKLVQIARKAVAIAMAVFGAGLVICTNLDPGPQVGPPSWAQRCGLGLLVGICGCFAAAVVLIIEHLARPARPKPFTFSSLILRFWLILTAIFAIGDLIAENFGAWQAIGAMAAGFLLLSVVRERGRRRFLSACFAAVMLGLTILGTQSSYQYARRHAEEIVTAGCELMDRVPEAEFHRYNPCPDADKSGVLALFGAEIQPTDPRVPDVLRNLEHAASGSIRSASPSASDARDCRFSEFPMTRSSIRSTASQTPPRPVIQSGGSREKATRRLRTGSGRTTTSDKPA